MKPFRHAKLLSFILLVAWCLSIPKVAGAVQQWSKLIGREYSFGIHEIAPIPGGGYVAMLTDWRPHARDYVIVRLDAHGNILWARRYDISADYGYSVRPTTDGGFIAAGVTISRQNGERKDEFWVLKLDGDGGVVWQKKFSGNRCEPFFFARQARDGGYLVGGTLAGWTEYPWILKLDALGGIVWQKRYSGLYWFGDSLSSLEPTPDNGCIATCGTMVFKLDADGLPQWRKAYGDAYIRAIHPLAAGGYVVTSSNWDTQRLEYYHWVGRLGEQGDIVWQKAYTVFPWARSFHVDDIRPTADGGSILAGNMFLEPPVLMKLDPGGNPEWAASYFPGGYNTLRSVQQTEDGGYIAQGGTYLAGYAAWVLKLDPAGDIDGCSLREETAFAAVDTAIVAVDADGTVLDTTATASDTHAVVTHTTMPMSSLCYDPGEITVARPDGGNFLQAGGERVISWWAPPEAVRFNLEFSRDRGLTWERVARRITGTRRFNWRVPVPSADIGPRCLVRVRGFDAGGNLVGMDRSDSFFGIRVLK